MAQSNHAEDSAAWEVDGDGFLSAADIQTGLRNHPESAERFRSGDKDRDNKLNRDEFVSRIRK